MDLFGTEWLGIDYEAPKYVENEYELDAYYTEYLYDEGFVDIYGKSKNGSIDHDSYARKTGFWNYMRRNHSIFYQKAYEKGKTDWKWSESTYHGPDF